MSRLPRSMEVIHGDGNLERTVCMYIYLCLHMVQLCIYVYVYIARVQEYIYKYCSGVPVYV